MATREIFESRLEAGLLLLPTILVSVVFLYYPTVRAIQLSFLDSSFGRQDRFAGLENYLTLLGSADYHASVVVTVVYAVLVVVGVMVFSLLVTFLIHEVSIGRSFYLISAIWPYALPPAVAGLVFLFLVHPNLGIVTTYVESVTGITVDWLSNGQQAFVVVLVAVIWKQVGYNVIFMIASMSNIPESLTETAEIDGVGRSKRLLWIYVPMMSPTLLFLVIMNTIYAFFHTFAFIDLMTQGGPAGATNILIFDLYQTAFKFYNFGLASAKSVVLFVVVGVLMYVQVYVTDAYAHYGG
jgi:sn-glycerol 3-phosphate transport system permease protein